MIYGRRYTNKCGVFPQEVYEATIVRQTTQPAVPKLQTLARQKMYLRNVLKFLLEILKYSFHRGVFVFVNSDLNECAVIGLSKAGFSRNVFVSHARILLIAFRNKFILPRKSLIVSKSYLNAILSLKLSLYTTFFKDDKIASIYKI